MQNEMPFDVVIVGASTAGCAAAVLFSRRGLKVALVEQNPHADAYKKICTHYILPAARPAMARLGLDHLVEQASGVRNSLALWTRWGWVPPVDVNTKNFGYNIRRQTFDPLLRSLAIEAPGVHFMPGWKAAALLRDGRRVCGLTIEDKQGEQRTLRAALTVAADGRESGMVELAGIPSKESPNIRFSCFAHFRNIPDEDRSFSRMWLLEPEIGYQFPNDDGTTLIAIMPMKTRLDEFKQDPEACYRRFIAALPGAPKLDGAEMISKIMMNSKNSNLLRGRAPDGMALIGDAAMTSDPLAGVGIAWALQSAEWLVEHLAEPIKQDAPLAPALKRYARQHRWELRAHHQTIRDMARVAPLNPFQRLLFSAAARDTRTAELVNDFLARDIGVGRFLSPGALGRALWVNLRHGLGGPRAGAQLARGGNQ
ncbi:NAD(P)/FAD-dependent oxidoreductase [Duganella sp. HH101]|uniref:NAD(P)/FAD-dependent oxidoreductase n=1 Tax=Duganella sp. HH101 TaxID=1781066 RepID=UPI0008746332|nr:NAD(P)/FAD-dependent oxidoreductase [Duganella sp. HH101]OEZ95689.1 kynurenine 3-monooxygenase [Duganella sp. HH101]